MIGMLVGAAVGGAASIFGARDAAKRQREQIKANRLAAKYKYSSTLDSVNLMKAATREQTANAIAEQVRAGGAAGRDVQDKVQAAAGTVIASSEGLTSGRSKGREMVGLYMKGNKVLQEVKNQTTSAVNQLVDIQDKRTNDLNNALLQSYQEMSAVLSNTGPDLGNNVAGFLSGAMGGASAGLSLESSYNTYQTTR